MKNIEYLADAIMAYTMYADPSSQQYRFRNPLGLKVFCAHAQLFKDCPECKDRPPEQTKTYNGVIHQRLYDRDTGLRIFSSHIQGYQASLFDLQLKCSGKSKSKVRDTSTIKELIRSYYLPEGTASCVARFMRKATGDETITENTPICSFLESGKEMAHA